MPKAAIIKAKREFFGWTQKEMAEALGVSVRTIEGWEAGRRTPSLTVFKYLDELEKIKKAKGAKK